MKTTTLVIALAFSCASCGQKGNLYLPNQKKPVPATQPQPQPNRPPATTPAGTQPPT